MNGNYSALNSVIHSMNVQTCSYEGCERKHSARGLCKAHYNQLHKGQKLEPIGAKWGRHTKRDNVTYKTAHKRLTKHYGKASGYLCHFCIDTGTVSSAQEWAYLGGSPSEQRETMNTQSHGQTDMPYCTNFAYYRPLCKSCHVRYDKLYLKIVQALRDC